MKEVVIRAKTKWYDLKLKEVIEYRDLIFLFVKRNYSTRFKQTILGPAWLIISPIFTIVTYTIVFGNIAGLSTDGLPHIIFYLAGNIIWTFFSGTFNSSVYIFTNNAGIFGKIYFPRLVTLISNTLTQAIDFFIQFVLMAILMIVYGIRGIEFNVNIWVFYLPLVLLQLGLLGMGMGIIVSSLTTKYRDLFVLVSFGLQIWMYVSPVIYSITLVPEKYMEIFMLNPVTPAILLFKHAFLGPSMVDMKYLIISWCVTIVSVIFGLIIFNKVEKNFMDTI